MEGLGLLSVRYTVGVGIGMAMTLNSGQWNRGGSDMSHIQTWPLNLSGHPARPPVFPPWPQTEWRRLRTGRSHTMEEAGFREDGREHEPPPSSDRDKSEK